MGPYTLTGCWHHFEGMVRSGSPTCLSASTGDDLQESVAIDRGGAIVSLPLHREIARGRMMATQPLSTIASTRLHQSSLRRSRGMRWVSVLVKRPHKEEKPVPEDIATEARIAERVLSDLPSLSRSPRGLHRTRDK